MTRDEFLQVVRNVTSGHRDNNGEEEDCFLTISKLWDAYLVAKCVEDDGTYSGLCGEDICVMMILLKVARYAHNHAKKDSLVDMAGYAACCVERIGE